MLLFNITLLVLIAAVLADTHQQQYREVRANIIDDVKDKVCPMGLLTNTQTASKLACSARCINNEDCLSFFYNGETGECKLHGAALDINSCSWTPFPGSRYYRLNRKLFGEECETSDDCIGRQLLCGSSGKCECSDGLQYHPVKTSCESGLVGQNCSSPGECLVAHSECGDDKCRCERGYSLSSRNQTCMKYCTQYGDSFQAFEDLSHDGHNFRIIFATTPAECARICMEQTSPICTTYETYAVGLECYIQTEDGSEFPNDFSIYGGNVYYERNCA